MVSVRKKYARLALFLFSKDKLKGAIHRLEHRVRLISWAELHLIALWVMRGGLCQVTMVRLDCHWLNIQNRQRPQVGDISYCLDIGKGSNKILHFLTLEVSINRLSCSRRGYHPISRHNPAVVGTSGSNWVLQREPGVHLEVTWPLFLTFYHSSEGIWEWCSLWN